MKLKILTLKIQNTQLEKINKIFNLNLANMNKLTIRN